jgi:hypothetical protein
MSKTFRFLFIQLIALTLIAFLSACGEEDGSGDLGSGGGNPDDPTDSVPVGDIEDSGFWINLQVSEGLEFDFILRDASNFDANCYIPATVTGPTLMECTLDILEGDLYLRQMDIQLNAPPGMCEAVSWRPAWHWNESSGFGPSEINLEEDASGDPAVASTCTARNASGAVVACSTLDELTDVTNINGPRCIYDRTSVGGKNCCFGEYEFNLDQDTDADGTADGIVASSDREWGGNPQECLSPYLSSFWETFSADGYPVGQVKPVQKDSQDQTVGFNEIVMGIPSNTSAFAVGFSYPSNFYTTAGNPHNHDGYVLAGTSNLPYAVDPIDDLDGSPMPRGQEFYTFTCLDAGYDIRHQIRLKIREWNTLAQFVAYSTSSGASGNPDVVGVEGTNCDYDTVFGGFSCNDLLDFDDVLTNAGGSYPTNPGGTAAQDRRTYFPNRDYD